MVFSQRGRIAPGLAVALAIALAALLRTSPALAISNGVPDGNGHPNVGLFAVEENGVRAVACSGLLMNSDVGEDNGGICFGDSGSPKLIPHTNTIVALASGGDAICRALNFNQRLDVADARAFLGRYVQLR